MAYGDQAQTGLWRGGRGRGRGRRRGRAVRASDRARQTTLRRQPPTARGRQTGARGAYGAEEQAEAIGTARSSNVSQRRQAGESEQARAGGNIVKKQLRRGREEA